MTERFFPADELLLYSVIDWSYDRILAGGSPMTGARPASELEAELADAISPEGIGGRAALEHWADTIIPATRAMGDPMNLAYVPAAPTAAALTFDLAVSSAQIMGGHWETGAGAIAAENQALRWLAELAGFPAEAGGAFVSGGTVGNLSALVAARHSAGQSREVRPERWAIAASRAVHSSIDNAARIMDVDVLWVDGDAEGRISGDTLDAAFAAHPGRADGVFAVVANVGATNAGIVDHLDSVADFCGRNDVWLHIDGAYGLAAMASPLVRAQLTGLERADSFVVDPHKWLFAPYDCCALVYRDPERSAAAHSQHAGYLEQVDREAWNPSDHAIHLSRRVRGLPLWFSLATYGTDHYAGAIEQALTTTREVVEGIRSSDHLELVMEPDLSVVLFRRPGWSEEQMTEWSEATADQAVALIVPTRWHDELMFRMCFVNPRTRSDRVLLVLDTMAD